MQTLSSFLLETENDCRFFRGLELVHQGYAPRMLVDANSDMIFFGQTPAVLEDQLIRSLNVKVDQVQVCQTQGDSTDEETRYVAQCLHNDQISNVLLVTSDFHTRRALSIFKHRLPKYRWSVAACRDDFVFKENWWQRRGGKQLTDGITNLPFSQRTPRNLVHDSDSSLKCFPLW